jgi:hypothetical protein
MTPTIRELFATPDNYLFSFEGDQAIFRRMDRAAYGRSIFLDRRISTAGDTAFQVPVAGLIDHLDATGHQAPRTGWIFHVAHCGSTLLARALDLPDRSLVLREPLALRQLGLDPRPADPRLRLVASLAGRRYRDDAPAIVKANVPVNFLASDLLAFDPKAPAIFLYFPLRTYLLAVLRSVGHRNWVANVTTVLQPVLAETIGDASGLHPAERAAALWLAQMRLYDAAIRQFPEARSLHAEDLFDRPRPVLAAAAAHLGVRMAPQDLDRIVGGKIFATYSKAPDRAFDNAARLELQAQTSRWLGPELDRARRWIDGRRVGLPPPSRLERPLAGSTSPLLEI